MVTIFSRPKIEKELFEQYKKPNIASQEDNFYSLRPALLENRDVNITSQFVRIFKVFEDFIFISQLREDMDKVRPAIATAIYKLGKNELL